MREWEKNEAGDINSDLNPPADWTQASAKFPIPTALTGREVTAGWSQEAQHFLSASTPPRYLLNKNTKSERGSLSLRYLCLFTARDACVLVFSLGDISPIPSDWVPF